MMLAIKPTSHQVQVKIFEMAGCEYVRTQGDHLIYRYSGAIRPVVISKYKEVPVFIIRNNMKVIGMSRERYAELIKKI
ncbi:MAG: type II toxin-antitoxin system HicA family toxin [Desulfobacterales bacterium]|nr:type II toxin-antitoxin system HicA family toxin [Desulfobacterales bacterium]